MLAIAFIVANACHLPKNELALENSERHCTPFSHEDYCKLSFPNEHYLNTIEFVVVISDAYLLLANGGELHSKVLINPG